MLKKITDQLLFLLFTFILFTAVSCNGGGSSSGGSSNGIGRIDITGAESLLLMPKSSSSGRYSENENVIYKITEDGAVIEVTITDDDGKEYSYNQFPNGIFNIDDNYVMITFGMDDFTNNGWCDSAYLTRKSDGAVFEIPEGYLPRCNGWNDAYTSIHFFSSGQYIFYLAEEGSYTASAYKRIVRLDISSPGNLTAQYWSSEAEDIESFTADSSGNVAYTSHPIGNWNTSDYRLKYHGGRLTNTDTENIWTGTDGKLYRVNNESGTYKYNRITFDSSGNVLESLLSEGPSIYNSSRFPISLADIQYCIDPWNERVIEIDYSAETVQLFDLSASMDSISNYEASDDYLYLAGKDNSSQPVLIRVEPGSGSTTSILSSDYDVYSLGVSADNCIEFNALRMSDGRKVVGKLENAHLLSTTTVPVILDESMNSKVVSLVRIK